MGKLPQSFCVNNFRDFCIQTILLTKVLKWRFNNNRCRIVERDSAHEMVFDPIHPYSRGLMRSILVPEEGARDVKLTAIPGTPPNLMHSPTSFRFAEHGRYATPACGVVSRPLPEIGGGRS